jgi:hypothetical protein
MVVAARNKQMINVTFDARGRKNECKSMTRNKRRAIIGIILHWLQNIRRKGVVVVRII